MGHKAGHAGHRVSSSVEKAQISADTSPIDVARHTEAVVTSGSPQNAARQSECGSISENGALISKWGGARANSGGSRIGAGRKPKSVASKYAEIEPAWFVATTFPGAERWARQNVERIGCRTYLPMCEVLKRDVVTPTMKHVVEEVLWPGYLLVHMACENTVLRALLDQPGVRGLLGKSKERPTPIPASIVDRLIREEPARLIERDGRERTGFAPLAMDDLVVITDGPFLGFEGRVILSTAEYAHIGLEIFGGLREVEVDRRVLRGIA